MTLDVARARAQTRGVSNVVHLNSAGSALMPIPVADALHEYLKDEEMSGGYETAGARAHQLDRFYDATARLINCQPTEVAFIENATRAWDMAFYGFPLGPGDRVLTAPQEYGSNMIAYLHDARRRGFTVDVVPPDAHGQIDLEALESMIDDNVKLISISHIPTGGGVINPAADVGKIAKRHGVAFLLDACQSIGQLEIDVDVIGCDFLSATGRKYIRGPRGTGFLYVREEWINKLDPPFLDQHAADLIAPDQFKVRTDAKRFENWECNFAGKVALGVAIDYAHDLGLASIQECVISLAAQLRERLSTIDGVTVWDEGVDKCGIVTFTHARVSPFGLQKAAAAAGINVSVSDGSGMMLDFTRRGLTAVVRSSVHYYNNDAELEQFTHLVASL
jgi:cysteine desulfurase / selenocysteine lyase